MIHYFRHPVSSYPLPGKFTNPFNYTPHPLCMLAAQEVQGYLAGMDLWTRHPEEGKMFGVLVVRTPQGKTGFLAAFSGILDGSYLHPGFVPPVYNLQQPDGFFRQEEQSISIINGQIRQLENDILYQQSRENLAAVSEQACQLLTAARARLKTAKAARDEQRAQHPDPATTEKLIRESQHQKAAYKRLERYWKEEITEAQSHVEAFARQIEVLKTERRERSAALQQRLFEQFRLLNARGEVKNLCDIFRENGHPIPPAGAGECAAPKLLQYAYLHHLQPLAMAEFWWGCPSQTEIRKPGHYYPSCQGKCGPILKHMLQGLDLMVSPEDVPQPSACFPEIVYEDPWLVIVNKPAGMLTVPGKTACTSLYDLACSRYPGADGPLVVHRLDMATSGLLMIAKNKSVHKNLQQQFLRHTVRKRYIALLEGVVAANEGCICLPLCLNPDDRPRQMVSEKYGKPATTYYQVLSRSAHQTRIAFYPRTGRTHQLRVHAAHPLGLNCPITGDMLYGNKAGRLYLHAEYLEFVHPVTGKIIKAESKADF